MAPQGEGPHVSQGSLLHRWKGRQQEVQDVRCVRPFHTAVRSSAPHAAWLSLQSHNSERFPKAALPSTDSSELTGTPMAGAEATGSCLPCRVAARPLSVLPAPSGAAGSGSAPVVSEA